MIDSAGNPDSITHAISLHFPKKAASRWFCGRKKDIENHEIYSETYIKDNMVSIKVNGETMLKGKLLQLANNSIK